MFDIKPSLPPGAKKLRKRITQKYGLIALFGVAAYLLLVALFNLLRSRQASRGKRRWSRQAARRHVVARSGIGARVPKVSTVVWWIVVVGFLGVVCLAETYNDLTFLVKRLGRVCTAFLPPLYLLSLRPTPLPQTLYLQVLPVHKLLGRIVVVIAVAHGVLYCYFYTVTHKLRKLTKAENVSGILAAFAFVAIGLTSLQPVRRRAYAFFYGVHTTLSWVSVGMVWYHANPPADGYMMSCLAILVFHALSRVWHSSTMKMPVQYVSPSLYLVVIPKQMAPKSLQTGRYTPGAHVRVSTPISRPWTWLQSSHPYTIASMPNEDSVKLVIRKSRFPIQLRALYSVWGPFNSLPCDLIEHKSVSQINRALLVVGGSGIAFGVPVFRHLRAHGVRVKLLWAIRDVREWKVLNTLGLDAQAFEDVEVYITASIIKKFSFEDGASRHGSTASDKPSNRLLRKASTAFEDQFLPKELNDDEDLGVSVQNEFCTGPGRPLDGGGGAANYSTFGALGEVIMSDEPRPSIFNHRPVLNLRLKSWLLGSEVNEDNCYCIDDLLDSTDVETQRSWVISSGATRLVNETRAWSEDNGFTFFAEDFTL